MLDKGKNLGKEQSNKSNVFKSYHSPKLLNIKYFFVDSVQ